MVNVSVEKKAFKEKDLIVQRTFRGKQCILVEMKSKKGTTRSFLVNGKIGLIESDENCDGFFEQFAVIDGETGDCEFFNRTNNSVAPISPTELQAINAKKTEADKMLSEFIKKHGAK